MSANTPAVGGETKPDVKHEGKPSYYGGRNNANRNNNNYNTQKKFLGADTNLCGEVFEAKRNRSEQVTNFKTVNDLINRGPVNICLLRFCYAFFCSIVQWGLYDQAKQGGSKKRSD